MKEEHLKPYQSYLEDLTKTFDKIEYTVIPRAHNQFVDSLFYTPYDSGPRSLMMLKF